MWGTESNRLAQLLMGFAVTMLLPLSINAQTSILACKNEAQATTNGVILEITRSGRGMIWPNLVPQLFFRLRENGLLEYEVRTGKQIRTRHQTINRAALSEIQGLIELRELRDARQEYPPLEDFKDAMMKTCVRYKQGDQYRHILLVNYMPGNPKAKGYYPLSLMKLLERVESIRPKADYERRLGLDKLSYQ